MNNHDTFNRLQSARDNSEPPEVYASDADAELFEAAVDEFIAANRDRIAARYYVEIEKLAAVNRAAQLERSILG